MAEVEAAAFWEIVEADASAEAEVSVEVAALEKTGPRKKKLRRQYAQIFDSPVVVKRKRMKFLGRRTKRKVSQHGADGGDGDGDKATSNSSEPEAGPATIESAGFAQPADVESVVDAVASVPLAVASVPLAASLGAFRPMPQMTAMERMWAGLSSC